jgi:sulfite reductase (NADPH) flavoprotein alpha-component
MNTVPVIPESAPFTLEQRAWLNGYLAGLFSRGAVDPLAAGVAPGAVATKAPPLTPLTILFGSQTGNAEGLAKRAAKEAGKRGFAATVRDMAGVALAALAQETHVLLIASTYGEGEPPDNAKALHEALLAASAAGEPKLASLRYSVCALGDTNYVHFCKCGKDLDAALEKLGATRAAALVECDVEFEAKFTIWLDAALGALTKTGGADTPASSAESAAASRPGERVEVGVAETVDGAAAGFSRQNPFPALVLASRKLNGEGSAKKVHHVEFDLADSGLTYEAGDALGVYAHNCPELVADVLAAIGCDGEEAVPAPDGASIPLRRALTEFYDLGKPTPELLERVLVPASMTGTADARKAAPAHQVIDALLVAGGAQIVPAEFVRALKRLQPRLYSISSSPVAHAGRVHVTVGAVLYEQAGRRRKGVCSTFLADRVQPGETRIGVFVHANKAFRLPANGDAPVIMVGPGTGIAPFRGFLHERRATSARGKNWLLFGDQRGATDFLYREELAELMRAGVLTRLDTAFSRDQAEKIYVQQRMLENAGELYAWLEAGAHFYVCGDASRMAKDVDAALHRAIESAGGKTSEQAAEYVQQLRTAKRYQRDVY